MADEKNDPHWKRGCVLGCAAVLAVLLAGGILAYRAASARLNQERDKLRDEFGATYAAMAESGKIPPDHRALLDGLVKTTRSEQASVFGVAAVSAAICLVLKDGVISESDLDMLRELERLLASSPGPGLAAVARFRDQFPELKASQENP